MLKKIFIFCLFLCVFLAVCGGFGLLWGYHYFSRDLPHFTSIDDYQPPMVSSMYAADGTLVAEFYEERRYPVELKEVPLHVRQAFLAAEDASFYEHPGFDVVSIARAFVKNLQTGTAKQGASTITQQVIKNMLLSREKKLERKIKEAILAYRLEKRLSKDEILELYLNQIYFGNSAYGIKSAARLYFKKELEELTIAEGALLAGLPKAPSRYSPINDFKASKRRQTYVLGRMYDVGFISKSAHAAAKAEDIAIYKASHKKILKAPYYVAEVRRLISERFEDFQLYKDGLEIHTALDLEAYLQAQTAVRNGVEKVDKRQGWRGPLANLESRDAYLARYAKETSELEPGKRYPAYVLEKSGQGIRVAVGEREAGIRIVKQSWVNNKPSKEGKVLWAPFLKRVAKGDIIEVRYTKNDKKDEPVFVVDQTPDLQSALVLLNPHTGLVPAIIGGYKYSESQFNRATQAKRQPGSSFKPIVYLAAIDGFDYRPATLVYDEPRAFHAGEEYWIPENYDENYLGPITLRSALEKSRNLISADIISRIGVDAVISYARKLGLKSKLGRNLSLSLGSSEVTPLEMTRAYGVFATGGVLANSIFITKILDRHKNVLYDYEAQGYAHARQVISPESSFLMAYMMKGVVEHGTGWRAKTLKRPIAAKTGTSNDQMDAWFIGYTPEWVCGVWTGHDVKRSIGPKETGGRVSAPIWIDFMGPFLKHEEERRYQELATQTENDARRLGLEYIEPEKLKPLDFSPPFGVRPVWINKNTGFLSSPQEEGAFLEYFKKGSEPTLRKPEVKEEDSLDYWNDPLL